MSVESFARATQSEAISFKPEVLIVESNPRAGAIIDLLLTRSGYQTHAVSDGQTALEYINNYEPVTLIILDVELPLIDGYTIVDQVHANHNWKNVPVVFLSSKATEKEIVKCFEIGASDYILKPFFPAEFVARVNRLIKKPS